MIILSCIIDYYSYRARISIYLHLSSRTLDIRHDAFQLPRHEFKIRNFILISEQIRGQFRGILLRYPLEFKVINNFFEGTFKSEPYILILGPIIEV